MKRLTQWAAVLTFAWLSACASLSHDQRVAIGYATNTSVREASTEAYQAGRIEEPAFRSVIEINNQIRSLLDVAADGDERSLDLAIELLEELEGFTDE